jgi:hypothetical protein
MGSKFVISSSMHHDYVCGTERKHFNMKKRKVETSNNIILQKMIIIIVLSLFVVYTKLFTLMIVPG